MIDIFQKSDILKFLEAEKLAFFHFFAIITTIITIIITLNMFRALLRDSSVQQTFIIKKLKTVFLFSLQLLNHLLQCWLVS